MSDWRFNIDGKTAFIAGPKAEARRRITACGDHSPPWVARRGAWATSPAVARRVLDQLDARNIRYALEDTSQLDLDLSDTEPADRPPARQGALW